jgi:hypothetical protein
MGIEEGSILLVIGKIWFAKSLFPRGSKAISSDPDVGSSSTEAVLDRLGDSEGYIHSTILLLSLSMKSIPLSVSWKPASTPASTAQAKSILDV